MFNKQYFWLLVLALIFLGVYFWLVTPWPVSAPVGLRFDWPDEVANYFWSSHYAQTDALTLAEPLNLAAENQIHPRSFNVTADGSLVPGSFLGLILLYGVLAKFFGSGAIIYFTPIFAILGTLAFYGVIKRIFDQRLAWLAAVLMFFHPGWWYYSATSMLPNVTFVSLLLISYYFLVKNKKISAEKFLGLTLAQKAEKIPWASLLLAALTGGLALAIRPAEIIWLALIYLVLMVFVKESLTPIRLVTFLAVVILMILPSLYHQQILYGSWAASGYSQLQSSDLTADAGCPACNVIEQLILPFGFHPVLIALNFWNHFLSRFWLWSLLATLGGVALLTSRRYSANRHFVYLFVSLAVGGFLAIYYGSWQFTDLLTLQLNCLGVSYVRYWLPVFILALPFVALGILWLTQFFYGRWRHLALFLILVFLGYQSAQLVLYQKADS